MNGSIKICNCIMLILKVIKDYPALRKSKWHPFIMKIMIYYPLITLILSRINENLMLQLWKIERNFERLILSRINEIVRRNLIKTQCK